MTRITFVPDLSACHGWAYEPCEELSRFVLEEHWADGSWSATGLCLTHARAAFDGHASEAHPPVARVWMAWIDWERYAAERMPVGDVGGCR